ncbi:MAG: DUF2095 family protein [Candidatus Thorarchaeota archaeon]
MENNRKDKKKEVKKPIIREEDGLTIIYDKNEFNEKFPHLITEIAGKKKSVKIDSIKTKANTTYLNSNKNHPKELVNPGAIDFIRRCTTIEEALNILDYLVKRRELSKSDYTSYKSQILEKEGLNEFINKHGGFKKPGYYEKKFRDQKQYTLNQNQQEN